MTESRKAFRAYCRLARMLERLERRGEDPDAVLDAMDRPWYRMDGREQELAGECLRRLRGERPWRRMFPAGAETASRGGEA